ncbi:hypothetical protein C2G38_2127267 [Gigaspora rosea]|uniref:Uncharacterized protein n=1 Tax=Gigaspora rosea TaxID=44941 RepID=A0A397U2F5_9GLOM|nr:hypothetical protein C2G38_2127267 [Gigaspora rosea]
MDRLVCIMKERMMIIMLFINHHFTITSLVNKRSHLISLLAMTLTYKTRFKYKYEKHTSLGLFTNLIFISVFFFYSVPFGLTLIFLDSKLHFF